MRTWTTPKIVKIDALPEVLGACATGGTHYENPGGNCQNGSLPLRNCGNGGGG